MGESLIVSVNGFQVSLVVVQFSYTQVLFDMLRHGFTTLPSQSMQPICSSVPLLVIQRCYYK
jgi:hypothetical protein